MRDQRGVALVVVLWVTVLLAVMAGVFSSVVRSEARGAANLVSQTRAYYMAAGGVNAAVAGIIDRQRQGGAQAAAPGEQTAQTEEEGWSADGRPRDLRFDGGVVTVRVFDEAGKLDVNKATRDDLVRLFVALGVKGAERDMVIDSILDWRDENNFHRLNGAEDDYYEQLPEPYGAKDAPLATIDELLWIKGVSPEMFYGDAPEGGGKEGEDEIALGLAGALTVYTGSLRVNVNTAPVGVLMSLPGVDREAAETIVRTREVFPLQDFSTLASITRGLNPGVSNYVTFASPGIYTIEATAHLDSSPMAHTLRAVVMATKDSMKVLYWKDRTYREVGNS